MALKQFTLRALPDLDGGRIGIAIEQAIERCQADCADRPGDRSARKVSLVIEITPNLDRDSPRPKLHSCDLRFKVVDSPPKRVSDVYEMRAAGRRPVLQ